MAKKPSKSLPSPKADAFSPVRGVRLYELIIDQIATLVQDGQLANGDRFPPERYLQEKWKVSRPVLREAFRALEMQGVVESRPGGGRYLRAGRIPHPSDFQAQHLAPDRETLLNIWDAREGAEVKAAGLAAVNASRAQLAAIGQPLRMLETMTPEAYPRGDVNQDFHAAIARACGNPLLEQIILDLLGRFHETGFEDLSADDDWGGLQSDHQPIYDAIAAGDRAAAEKAMATHFHSLRKRLEE
ncbi:MAG: FadR family transcriptional regulator [Rhodospirillales bacterium]|nr:FadR family transcriptional regulator [Rhodospirillales bacterium]